MFGPKVKLEKGLYDRLKKISEFSGYSSVDEFVVHVLEREIDRISKDDDEEKLKERLKGLGYIS
jgi:hypothetical protein